MIKICWQNHRQILLGGGVSNVQGGGEHGAHSAPKQAATWVWKWKEMFGLI